MKHKTGIILINLLLLFSMTCLGQSSMENYFGENHFKEFRHDINGVEISIDPRVEFFQVLNVVAGNPALNVNDMDYKLSVIRYFEKYKGNPSLEYIRDNFGRLFQSIDEPYRFMVSLNNDLTYREDLVNNRWKDMPGMEPFINAMRTFLVETDFVDFFNSQADLYDLVMRNTIYTFRDFDEKDRILRYFGVDDADAHRFFLILNFMGFGNFGKGVQTVSGEEHYAIVTPASSAASLPVFDKNSTLALIWHEFGHSFSNPLVDKYWGDFENLSELNDPIKESMSAQFYQDWHAVVYEHLVRAITCRLGSDKYSDDFAALNLDRFELGQKFIYTVPILDALKVYEQSRQEYPDLESFMPEIVKAMQAVSRNDINNWMKRAIQAREPDVNDIPALGKIYNVENRLLILSSAEQDSEGDKRLKDYIKNTHSDYRVVMDTVALRMDLGNYNLFAIGSPQGNKFIEKYIGLIPVIITPGSLVTNNVYEGTGYAFLTGWVNPENPSNIMVIYAAQDPDDLVNFKMIPRGSTDYQVVRNLITIKADDYKRVRLIWSCF